MRKILYSKIGLIVALVALVLLNIATAIWHKRIDLTEGKRYTLSNATKALLSKVDAPVTVNVILKGNYPSGFRQLAGASEDMLREFRQIAGGNFSYQLLSPDENFPGSDISYGDTLSSMGFYPINLTAQVKEGQQQQLVYPYAIVEYEGKKVPVTLYQGKTPLINFQELSSAEAMLEYNFAEGISKVLQKEKPVIGYLTGNNEPTGLSVFDLVENTLKPNYQLFTVNINEQATIPQEFKMVMMVKPTMPFSDEAKLKIDQYVMNGGNLVVFIDRLDAELDTLQRGEVVAYDRELKINDLLFKYGARVNPDLVMDLQCDFLPFDVNNNGQFELLPWNYFPVVEPKGNHGITKNLGFISGRFMNSVDTVEADGIKKTVVLSSSANSRSISTPALISGKENSLEPQNERFTKQNIPLAVLLEGKFTSLYANRATQAMKDSLQKAGKTFQRQGQSEAKVIVVGDGDIVLNAAIRSEPIPMGSNPYTYGTQREFPFANRAFIENILAYMVNTDGLSEAKGKDYQVRLLDQKRKEEEKTKWQVINIALPIVIIILFAILFNWLRKRKYSKKVYG